MIIPRITFICILMRINITLSSPAYSYFHTLKDIFDVLALKDIKPESRRYSEGKVRISLNEDLIRGRLESLVQNPNEYMREVTQNYKTLLEGNILLAKNDQRQQENFIRSDDKPVRTFNEYLESLCKNIPLTLGFKSNEFQFAASLEREIETPILTTRCRIGIFGVIHLEFWIQSLKFKKYSWVENYKNLIGILDQKRNFIPLEIIRFSDDRLDFGHFPAPKTEKNSYLKHLLEKCYSFEEIDYFAKKKDNLLDFMIEDKNVVQKGPTRMHLERFYANLKEDNKLLTNFQIEKYEQMMNAKGYRHNFFVQSNHHDELTSLCEVISKAFVWTGTNGPNTDEAVLTILNNEIFHTALCTITTDHQYKVKIYIRTVFNERFLYIVGRMIGSKFTPLELAHLYGGGDLVLGVLPPENPKDNVFGPKRNAGILTGSISRSHSINAEAFASPERESPKIDRSGSRKLDGTGSGNAPRSPSPKGKDIKIDRSGSPTLDRTGYGNTPRSASAKGKDVKIDRSGSRKLDGTGSGNARRSASPGGNDIKTARPGSKNLDRAGSGNVPYGDKASFQSSARPVFNQSSKSSSKK